VYKEDTRIYFSDRCIFFTENGSYGIGPMCMRAGGTIWGGIRRMCLGREARSMNGELVREVEAGNRHEQRFCLV
jgi:hypothetical protein